MNVEISPEAISRKERSEAILVAEGVPVNKGLPTIEVEADAKRRTMEEVAYRAQALLLAAMKGGLVDQPTLDHLVAYYGLESQFSPKEHAFMIDPCPSEFDRRTYCWRFEATWALLWALGYVEVLDQPNGTCDVYRAIDISHQRTLSQFVADATLRPISDLLDQTDLCYRYHWAVVEGQIDQSELPGRLAAGVNYERLYALSWLVGYTDQEWDDITIDM